MASPKKVTPPEVFTPADWELADASAIQALARGDADETQQKRALNWVVNNACATYDLAYRTDSRDHAFAEGRRFAGLQVVKMLKINVGAIRAAKEKA